MLEKQDEMVREGRNAALIRAGAQAIAKWRKENPDGVIAAEHVTVKHLNLSGADFSRANLAGGHFVDCNFCHANFANANLHAAKFENCELEDSDFRGAHLKAARIHAKSLDGAWFGASLGRLNRLQVVQHVRRPISVDRKELSWYDQWIGWDRLRFLATIRIFVPAYTSLTLTVIYLNGIAWYNSSIAFLNAQVARSGLPSAIPPLPTIIPTWTHALVLANFASLAMAATCFLGCPARVVEFSRERWTNEFKEPELLYDHATWQRPLTRLLCAAGLLVGGLLSAFLLGKGIIQQTAFMLNHIG